jgi:hypothetical protein
MGRAMFTIIGAMTELQSSLISERVTAGMQSDGGARKAPGRPATSRRIIGEIEALAMSTDLSFVRFRGRSEAKRAVGSWERSPNASGPSSHPPCDHFFYTPEPTQPRRIFINLE